MKTTFHTFQLHPAIERLISETPMLPETEEWQLARDGSEESREQLILANMRLVKSIVSEFRGCMVDASELFSAGVTGLVQAVDAFQPAREIRLATFAWDYIRGEILLCIDQHRTDFHLPGPLRRQVRQYRAACQKIREDAPDTALADALGWPLETVQYVRFCSEHQVAESLDGLRDEENTGSSPLETLATEDRRIAQFEAAHDLEVYLSHVSPLEAKMLRMNYGIGISEPMSQRAISEELGISASTVGRKLHGALQRLHKLAQRERRTGRLD